MMSWCRFCLRLLIAVFAVSVVTVAATTSPNGIVTNTTVASTASKDGSTSVPPSKTMNKNTTAAPTTTPLPATNNSTESTTASAETMNVSTVTSTMQAATTASTPTQLTTTIAADGVNTTTGSVSVTAIGNTTTPSLSQGTTTTAPLDTTAGPQRNTTTSPNSTAGPQWTTTMHTSPATPEMTSMTGAPSSAVPTNPSIAVTNSTFTPQTESTTTTTTTTTTQTPTTTAISIVSTLSPNMAGLFVLSLTVGSNSNITCLGTCDAENIRNLTTLAFYGKAGFYDVRIVPMTNRRKRDVTPVRVMLKVRFIASSLLELYENNVSQMVKSALQKLNESGSVIINDDIMDTIANDFALTSRNVCQAVGVCDLGYVCQLRSGRAACYHLCDEDSTWSCGQHGTCQVHVMEGQAQKSCKCDSDYDNVWSGDKCQDSEISGEKKARIAGGVLGAFCGVFIIIIIVLLVLRGGCCGGTSSQKTYHLGMSNAGYTDISMEKI